MFCRNCGKEIDDKASVCPGCGVACEPGNSVVWAVSSFIFPIVGLILYFAFKDCHPKSSKASGIGAAAGAVFVLIPFLTAAAVFVPDLLKEKSIESAQNDAVVCMTNLKNIGTACEMFSTDNKGLYPASILHIKV